MTLASVFDSLAADYDAGFTKTPLGRVLREAVWRRLDACFAPGDRVLDLACGTGEDAVHLAQRGIQVLASDGSSGMLEVAARKVALADVGRLVTLVRLDLDTLAARGKAAPQLSGWPPFDGVLSNFGGLNCFEDLAGVASALAGVVRRKGRVFLCLMGRWVPWEWAWFLLRRDPGRAFRRLRGGGTLWRGALVRYPPVAQTRRAFSPSFRTTRAWALGVLLPPSYAGDWIARRPKLLRRLNEWERRLERLAPLVRLADHYVLELERQ